MLICGAFLGIVTGPYDEMGLLLRVASLSHHNFPSVGEIGWDLRRGGTLKLKSI